MNILFLIGNGFDLNLGLKTRYLDFIKYYLDIESINEVVQKHKNNILKDYPNWSDLELALGAYTENILLPTEFDLFFEDILDHLGDYLTEQEQILHINKINISKFLEYLCYPDQSLPQGDRNKILTFKEKWESHEWYIRIITFNYTYILDKLLQEFKKESVVGTHHNEIKIKFRGLEHIHGYVDNRMIMGVNDIGQIKNQDFHKNPDIVEAFIKPKCNAAQKHTIDEWCEDQIKSANLICIFGSSLGETDAHWWKEIGERLRDDCKLIIFTKGEEIKIRKGYLRGRVERDIKQLFLKRTGLSGEDRISTEEKIFIGVNTDVFSKMTFE